ncbi:Aegerolysin-domain-containing protein [Neurospora hispaniola]|uniref:Aegerolysin-domain-containing protein n=1 Tax=Neurospora hispaniola TaxID=588809 RepID=A0AAJ0I4S4_9PEZI|nr:Aegerolysin-domain-containing protein [Neurospora hispaniola]
MATLQTGFSTRLLTFGLLLIALVAGTFAAPLRVDYEPALPPTGAPPSRPGPTINRQRSTNAEYLGVDMTILNQASSGDLFIRNAHLSSGKWFEYPDAGEQLSHDQVEAKSASPNGGSMVVASSGRAWTPTGTEGHFDIYHDDTKVCHVYWDCPWSRRSNSFEVSEVDDNYVVEATGASLNKGPLGSITIEVVDTGEGE